MMNTMKKAKICKSCKITPLTPEEEASDHKRCYWCAVALQKQLLQTLGANEDEIEDPDPEEFGRTAEEIKLGRPSEAEAESSVAARPSKDINNVVGFQKPAKDSPDFTDGAKTFFKAVGLDMENPQPYTVIETKKGKQDTSLRFTISADIDPRWREAIQGILEQNLEQLIKMLTFGQKHDSILDDVNRALRPPQGPGGPFNME